MISIIQKWLSCFKIPSFRINLIFILTSPHLINEWINITYSRTSRITKGYRDFFFIFQWLIKIRKPNNNLKFNKIIKKANIETFKVSRASPIKGILDKESVEQSVGEAGIIEEVPVFTCKSSDVTDATFNDTLVIDSVTYYIKELFPDGTGVTRITLSG